jgi:hypothetical protein
MTIFNRLTVVLLIALGTFKTAISANFYSISSGNGVWTTVGNWSNTLNGPSNGTTPNYSATSGTDNIRILTNITLTGNLTVNANTQLRLFVGTTLTINGAADFQNGSLVTVDSGAVLTINGNLNNSNNSNGIVVNGTINVNGNITGGNGSTIVSTNGYNGQVNSTGSITLNGSGQIFGSMADCPTGPCSTSANSPLPIILIYFRAALTGGTVKIDWATAAEINNDYFVIEKSANGKDYTAMTTINGAGNSTSNNYYNTVDERPYSPISYYRLKQVDFNGTTTYSKVVALRISGKDFESMNIQSDYGNGSIRVTLGGIYKGKADYRLSDALGNIIASNIIQAVDGVTEIKIDASRLARGVYYFNIRNAGEAITKKIFY